MIEQHQHPFDTNKPDNSKKLLTLLFIILLVGGTIGLLYDFNVVQANLKSDKKTLG